MQNPLTLRANFYSQFNADYTRDVPAEGYTGWHNDRIDIEPHRVAVVLMHAWDAGTLEQNPGAWHCCDEVPRTYHVCRTVLPPLLAAIRNTPIPIFHVVGGAGYFEELPGYKKALALAGADDPAYPQVDKDGLYWPTKNFITDRTFPGKQNKIDLQKAPPTRFPKEAVPLPTEGIAKNANQLFALCKDAGINHLIYTGFNIDWCLLMSPAGMNDMWRHGLICSAIRQAVTAVENKETARKELCKEIGLWRVSVQGGLVLNDAEFIEDIAPLAKNPAPTPAAKPAAPTTASLHPTWLEAAGEVYGAKPDAYGPIGGGPGVAAPVTTGDHLAHDLPSLLAALAKATPGQTVFIQADAAIDLTELAYTQDRTCLTLPPGVTLASNRGQGNAPGALLYCDAFHGVGITVPGPNSRITGLRLRGPDGKRRLAFHHQVFYAEPAPPIGRSEAYYQLPNSDGILAEAGPITVDNCELFNWSHGGVYLRKGRGHHIHHNFIHHIQRMGLGYGICHNFDAQSLIERNLFQDCKHHIAGTGSPGQGYEAAHNVVLPYTESHVFNGKVYGQDHLFDVHGGEDRLDGTDIAGENFDIHHNIFMSEYAAVVVRGTPTGHALIHHNWFYAPAPQVIRPSEWSAKKPAPVVIANTPEHTPTYKNAYGYPPHARIGLD